ncbi:sigma-70 region 4 domain-containing protein [Hoyosella sp. G463]|uniref:Sigma-70 region 4 domain-containing protein n=1 Tax=Lolliginicoccus lacisalsi TaxID=2742202 RepID=A0A927PMT3_9ACTN|nr:sigma-70 region 4 domain-containing protein [Lolliginicoccus lacisalsi]MBD8507067.1 sigma-70 region 4 domain-containing protein [Lolliginicoccus lacisalsi]
MFTDELSKVRGKIGIAGRGDFIDDAVCALLATEGFHATTQIRREPASRFDLIVIRPPDAYRGPDHFTTVAAAAPRHLVLGQPDPATIARFPAARWLPSNVDGSTFLATVTELIGRPHPAPAPRRKPALSARERAAVVHYSLGMTVRQVAVELGVAPTTVSTHLDRARAKYVAAGRGAEGKIGLLRCALEDGLIPCPCHRGTASAAGLVIG